SRLVSLQEISSRKLAGGSLPGDPARRLLHAYLLRRMSLEPVRTLPGCDQAAVPGPQARAWGYGGSGRDRPGEPDHPRRLPDGGLVVPARGEPAVGTFGPLP